MSVYELFDIRIEFYVWKVATLSSARKQNNIIVIIIQNPPTITSHNYTSNRYAPQKYQQRKPAACGGSISLKTQFWSIATRQYDVFCGRVHRAAGGMIGRKGSYQTSEIPRHVVGCVSPLGVFTQCDIHIVHVAQYTRCNYYTSLAAAPCSLFRREMVSQSETSDHGHGNVHGRLKMSTN